MAIQLSFQDALREIKNRFDVLSIISKYIPVKKSGNSFVSVCPFHNDKSPSMHISPSKGIFKCFSCGASGDFLKFLVDYKKTPFMDVVKELAEECGIEIMQREKSPELSQEQELLFKLNKIAADFFENNLATHTEAKPVQNYLLNTRQLSEATIKDFSLGYSLQNKTALFEHLKTYAEFTEYINNVEFLIRCGLFLEDKNNIELVIDRFRGRLMIPIKDREGRIIAFGARALESNTHSNTQANTQPKYLNSPETPIYHKSHHLFGWNIASNFTREKRKVLLLEGYFDVIQAHQRGIDYAVGSLGTALTKEQVSILYQSNLSRRIILGFDVDNAGLRALESSLNVFQESKFSQKLELQVLQFDDDSKDIDEYLIKNSIEKMDKLLENLPAAYPFLIRNKVQNTNLDNTTERSETLNNLIELIAKVQDPIEREILSESCARELSFTKSTIMQMLSKKIDSHKTYSESVSNTFKADGNSSRFSGNNKNNQKKILRGYTSTLAKKQNNRTDKLILSLLLLTSDEELIRKISEYIIEDPTLKDTKETLLWKPLPDRLSLITQAENEIEVNLRELIDIAKSNEKANVQELFNQIVEEQNKYAKFMKVVKSKTGN
jgi:DNA primase